LVVGNQFFDVDYDERVVVLEMAGPDGHVQEIWVVDVRES